MLRGQRRFAHRLLSELREDRALRLDPQRQWVTVEHAVADGRRREGQGPMGAEGVRP